jgi:diguanylate cyclase (GGDEF)-like protein/PAS domain S-box-containing protein
MLDAVEAYIVKTFAKGSVFPSPAGSETCQAQKTQNHAGLKHLSNGSQHAVICANHRGQIEFWNPAAEQLFGYTENEALGQSLKMIVPAKARLRLAIRLKRMFKAQPPGDILARQLETEALRRDGSRFPVKVSLTAWTNNGRRGFGVIVRDVSELCSSEAQLLHMAGHDALTGLPNRTGLFSQMAPIVARRTAGALIMIDLHDFAGINRAHGNAFGDYVIQCATKAIASCLRANDLIAHWGGDRFCIYLVSLTRADQIIALCNRLAASLQKIDRQPGQLNASMGVAVFPEDADETEDLVACTELALDQARRENTQICFFEPQLREHAKARHRYAFQLRDALTRHEFEVFYQPQFRIADKRLVGAEALLRWRHPVDGLIMPADFLPTLENSALASPVGDWVLSTACAQASRWRTAYNCDFTIGVNLFGMQLKMGDLETTVWHVLSETALPAHALELEITENIVLHNHEAIVAPFQHLREAGVGIAFDDYGTGYASLSLLKRYPLSRLKIDRSFVWALETSAEDRAVVQAVLGLGEGFNLRVIAEGVESVEQLALLREAGCQEAQGYLVSKPVPADEFEQRFLKTP